MVVGCLLVVVWYSFAGWFVGLVGVALLFCSLVAVNSVALIY